MNENLTKLRKMDIKIFLRLLIVTTIAMCFTSSCLTPGPTVERPTYYTTYAIHYPDTTVTKTSEFTPKSDIEDSIFPTVVVTKYGNNLVLTSDLLMPLGLGYQKLEGSMCPIEIISFKKVSGF